MKPDHVVMLNRMYIYQKDETVDITLQLHEREKLATAMSGDLLAAVEVESDVPTGRVFLGIIELVPDETPDQEYISIRMPTAVVVHDAVLQHSYDVLFDDKYIHAAKEAFNGQDT